METFREKRRQDELLRVAEQAAEWLIALEEEGPKVRVAFAEWLEDSPLHVEMFLRASAVDRMGSLLSAEDHLRLANLPVESCIPVSSLCGEAWQSSSDARVARKQRAFPWAAALATVLAIGGFASWWHVAGPPSWERYATTVGEQRSVDLGDGSIVYVNTDTRVDVRYSEHARELRLAKGEALFKVAPDPARPFRVHVGDTVVQAIGTQFNIYRGPARTTVAVIEGSVQIAGRREGVSAMPAAAGIPNGQAAQAMQPEAARGARKAERLSAGQGMSLAANGGIIEQPSSVNVAQVTAWRQRRLVFEWQTLDTIASEFNRYNESPQIRVEGGDIGARRYTAVFDADNPQTLLKFLARDGDLTFTAQGDELVIRAR